jgi:hypothetical protein
MVVPLIKRAMGQLYIYIVDVRVNILVIWFFKEMLALYVNKQPVKLIFIYSLLFVIGCRALL